MEPDTTDNIDQSTFSRRRISSILKAPRKSASIPYPEEQKNVVECSKPGEKRKSRRVSFAATNDVLLFSKDLKNASPARSPFKVLPATTTGITPNRDQVGVTEDSSQQIAGMENLLNAPLHDYQQRERDKVNFDTSENLGQKSVMFFTNDASMDMTQSHTINIATDGDLSGDISFQNNDLLPTVKDKTVMFPEEPLFTEKTPGPTGSMAEGSVPFFTGRDQKNIPALKPLQDSEFEKFLASLTQPPVPSVKAPISKVAPPPGRLSGDKNRSFSQAQRDDVDKENQVQPSAYAVMRKSLNASRKSEEFPAALCLRDTVTEAPSDYNQEAKEEVDPFQWLFPSQEMYSNSVQRGSQRTETVEPKPLLSSGERTVKFTVDDTGMDMTKTHTINIATHMDPKLPNVEPVPPGGERTVRFTVDDTGMDMTKTHTINIATHMDPKLLNVEPVPPGGERTVRFTVDDAGMDMTKTHTINIATHMDPKLPNVEPVPPGGERTVRFTVDDAGMDMTKSHTINIATHMDPKLPNVEPVPPGGERTVRFTVDDAGMDMTKTHTINIATHMDPKLLNVEPVPPGEERTVRFTVDDAGMDMTKTHTINIATHMDPKLLNVEPVPPGGERTVRFTADDAGMDMTKTHTINIATHMDPKLLNVEPVPPGGERTVRFTVDDAGMDMTKTHTINIATHMDPKLLNVEPVPPGGERTVRFTVDDAGMDMTKTHTINIATHMDPKLPNVEPVPPGGERTVRFTVDDAGMDMTKSHTINIATHMDPKLPNVEPVPPGGERTVRFTADDAGMDMTKTHTINIATHMDPKLLNVEPVPPGGERTVRFTVDDAGMDMTKTHTINIATHMDPKLLNVEPVPPGGERTVRFTVDYAGMDMTKTHTINIATHMDPKLLNVEPVPPGGERTVRFTADDEAMDETRSHTGNIVSHSMRKAQNLDHLSKSGDKTLRFTAEDKGMDVTRSHTVNIATHFEPKSQNKDSTPALGVKTVGVSAGDPTMEMTQCLTANISSYSSSEPFPPHHHVSPIWKIMDSSTTGKKEESGTSGPYEDKSFSVPVLNEELSKLETSEIPFPQETNDQDQGKAQKPDANAKIEALHLGSNVMETSVNQTTTGRLDIDTNMDLTEAQTGPLWEQSNDTNIDLTEARTGHISEETCSNETPRSISLTQSQDSGHLKETESLSISSSSVPDEMGIRNLPEALEANKMTIQGEFEPSSRTCPMPQTVGSSPGPVGRGAEGVDSRKSRRRSLADLQSKVRRLSHMIQAESKPAAAESSPTPSSSEEHDSEKNLEDKPRSSASEQGLQMENQTQDLSPATLKEFPAPAATPFNLKAKQLMSLISVSGFQPKLPQKRSKADVSKRNAKTVTTSAATHVDSDVSDICDEDLGSLEDVLETFGSLQKGPEKEDSHEEFELREFPLTQEVFEEGFVHPVSGQKRPLSEDDNMMVNEKRMKASTDTTGVDSQPIVAECDGNTSTACGTIESSSCGYTGSTRCETTFESTFKPSLFESQLEDYASDLQMKLEDGTITVSDFFKLFHIDFVIHNPRQSVHRTRLPSDAEVTLMDLLRDRHINLPKVAVYKADVQALTEKVERLKFRMVDLEKPLKTVNRRLWEEMTCCSEEELKSFGLKLKERHNFFREISKAKSHEMKEVLYMNLVQANLDEQQKLRGTLEKADEMLKSLDDCISEVQAELAALEGKGSEDKPGLETLQEEIKKNTDTLADKEREICELELQKEPNSHKLEELKVETETLQRHMGMLNELKEWEVEERRDDRVVYTFLYETMRLKLTFGKSDGNDAESRSTQKITDINFKFKLDGEKSKCHARLVHTLVSQHIQAQTAWVEKYPTRSHVPMLLQDVSLVVSHCRLLGEECKRLKMWGSLPFDICHLSCSDTRVHIVFSCLEKLSKFEVIFAISLRNHLYVVQVDDFKNRIGSITVQQIEDIVASLTPARNLLTKIVKKIHDILLS